MKMLTHRILAIGIVVLVLFIAFVKMPLNGEEIPKDDNLPFSSSTTVIATATSSVVNVVMSCADFFEKESCENQASCYWDLPRVSCPAEDNVSCVEAARRNAACKTK